MPDPAPRPTKEETAYARGVRDTGVALVDMVDICDHALAALREMNAPQAVAGGIAAARDQLIAQFDKIGLESVFPLGQRFDPMMHEAIGVETCTEGERDGLICRVHRRGWLQDGTVVRAAMVSVYQAVVITDPPGQPAAAERTSEEAVPQPPRRHAAPSPPVQAADSPSARRRRQRDRTGMDSFAFTYQPEQQQEPDVDG